MSDFSHLNDAGEANMVDVTAKRSTQRLAVAQAKIILSEAVMQQIREQSIAKGDLLATARISGIQAAKKCSDLIPLCHPLPLTKVTVDINELKGQTLGLSIQATCKTTGQTGVEMEALTAVSMAALTVYDMCKAIDKSIVISDIKLLEKHGGKSGEWVRDDD